MTLSRFAALVGAIALSGCASQSQSDATAWYNGQDAVAPKNNRVYVCHSFGCARKTPVDFSNRDLARLKSILASGRGSPEEERAAIARAVSWQEKRVGHVVGSSNDVGGFDMHNAGVVGQMDCIDEASNTTSLLLIAEKKGLLRHHKVASPVARGFFLDGRYPHATATIKEKKTGTAFAVDSWPDANGVPPQIKPLDIWFSESSS